jgi:hypothetical protein
LDSLLAQLLSLKDQGVHGNVNFAATASGIHLMPVEPDEIEDFETPPKRAKH